MTCNVYLGNECQKIKKEIRQETKNFEANVLIIHPSIHPKGHGLQLADINYSPKDEKKLKNISKLQCIFIFIALKKYTAHLIIIMVIAAILLNGWRR